MKMKLAVATLALIVLSVVSIPRTQALDYIPVDRTVWVHDYGSTNPVPSGTPVYVSSTWDTRDLSGSTDIDGYYIKTFHDPFGWTAPDPNGDPPDSWTSTVDEVPHWFPVGPTTITTGPNVLLHEHIWEGDYFQQ